MHGFAFGPSCAPRPVGLPGSVRGVTVIALRCTGRTAVTVSAHVTRFSIILVSRSVHSDQREDPRILSAAYSRCTDPAPPGREKSKNCGVRSYCSFLISVCLDCTCTTSMYTDKWLQSPTTPRYRYSRQPYGHRQAYTEAALYVAALLCSSAAAQ